MGAETRVFVQTYIQRNKFTQNLTQLRAQAAYSETLTNTYYKLVYPDIFTSVNETEIIIPSKVDSYNITVSVYTPVNYAKNSPIIIYFHGGDFILNSRQSVRPSLIHLAADSGALILSVEYRLAPENKFPIGLDDAKSVVEYVVANKSKINANAVNASIGVAGDSAGGNFAAVIANELKDKIKFQILIYASLAVSQLTASRLEFKTKQYIIPIEIIQFFSSLYVNDSNAYLDTRAVPLLGVNSNTSRALIFAMELDPFRDDSKLYANALIYYNVSCSLIVVPGTVRGVFIDPLYCPLSFSYMKTTIINFLKSL